MGQKSSKEDTNKRSCFSVDGKFMLSWIYK